MSDSDSKYISNIIRQRIQHAGVRFNANDNIADFIEEGELDQLQAEVEEKMTEVLKSLVIDIDTDHNTQETARRVAKMYVREVFGGRYHSMPPITEFPNIEKLSELIIIGPIQVRSACSHHLCPIMGQVWIGVLPDSNSNLIGLSKYARITNWVMGRPQIQEEAIVQLADLLNDKMKPQGLAIVMKADHFCMQWRGVKDMNSKMINSVMRGAFLKNSDLRKEFLDLLPLNKN
ncbi:GTP cyclohydrolase [Oligella urethralis]|uniref:GTP cyclohydrolase I n=1 Tax=Oligella urethralis TaxID=90245 RepID=UPI000C9CF26B|nr:GTP cyclohydrolase I [Oligella urethralis]PMC16263.1 GTP cyclohydrolase [Oligella urethralis]